jgi:small ligand-binding sensory domain FIST
VTAHPQSASALVIGEDPATVIDEAAQRVLDAIGDAPDLVVMFASPALCREPSVLLDAIYARLAPGHLIGCTGEAIIGTGREIEDGAALSLWAIRLPGAEIIELRLETDLEAGGALVGWPFVDADDPSLDGMALVVADPFTFSADALLAHTNAADLPLVGGMASGGRRPGEHVVFLGHDAHHDGAVGVVISGANVVAAVSQGCAPIGPEMVVTDAQDGGRVDELAGQPAVAKVEAVIDELDPTTRRLAAGGLLAGVVIDENVPEYGRGDFLIRGILGGDRETGRLLVGENVRVGQTVRLHVRDARSADDDLRAALRDARSHVGGTPTAALLFTCNGRGRHMFEIPDHDALAVSEEISDIPLAGLFCNGEIGPVGGTNFIHGFTATLAIFGPSPVDRDPV